MNKEYEVYVLQYIYIKVMMSILPMTLDDTISLADHQIKSVCQS